MSDDGRMPPRYGFDVNGYARQMYDGYWTPWHIAKAEITALRAALDQERADNERLRAFAREFFGRHWNIRSYAIPDVRRLAAKHGLINNVEDAMPTELIRIGGALLSGRGEGGNDAQ